MGDFCSRLVWLHSYPTLQAWTKVSGCIPSISAGGCLPFHSHYSSLSMMNSGNSFSVACHLATGLKGKPTTNFSSSNLKIDKRNHVVSICSIKCSPDNLEVSFCYQIRHQHHE